MIISIKNPYFKPGKVNSNMTHIIDGRAMADELLAEIANKIKNYQLLPRLQIVMVGDNLASTIYTKNKLNAARRVGMEAELLALDANTTTQELLAHIDGFNADRCVHGIIVQLPLPSHIDTSTIIERIAPHKDVDCFHPVNLGRLFLGRSTLFKPCTPSGCIHILARSGVEVAGKHVVIVGRSNIVGKPLGLMLTNLDATVTLCHSRTHDLPNLMRLGDIVVCAVGKAHLFDVGYFKTGAVVIDVGISKVDGMLCGDVNAGSVLSAVGMLTPVPGGVGPMTVAYLIKNTLDAAIAAWNDH